MLQVVVSLTDGSRGIIYYCNIIILQATGKVLDSLTNNRIASESRTVAYTGACTIKLFMVVIYGFS
jgi:hypothetical protein